MLKTLLICVAILGCASYVAFAQDVQPESEVTVGEAIVVDDAPVADPVVAAEENILAVLGEIFKHAKAGNYRMVYALILILAMVGLKMVRTKYGGTWGKRFGALSLMVLTFGTGLATALTSSTAISLQMVLTLFGTALMAAGGYTLFRDVFGDQKA